MNHRTIKHTAGFLFCLTVVYIYNDIFEGKSFDDMTLDELNEREDDIDEEEERIFETYRFVYMSEFDSFLNIFISLLAKGAVVVVIVW